METDIQGGLKRKQKPFRETEFSTDQKQTLKKHLLRPFQNGQQQLSVCMLINFMKIVYQILKLPFHSPKRITML